MNIRKEHDYSALYAGIDRVVCVNLSQMELYCALGRLICARSEKGAAVAAAAYLTEKYPNKAGFSARNVRRMRDFYRMYENVPVLLAQAMRIGWTQNVVILEADLTVEERAWYLRVAEQFGWSKLTLQKKIAEAAHLAKALDPAPEICYNKRKTIHQSRSPRSDLQLCDTEPNKAAEVAFAQNDTRQGVSVPVGAQACIGKIFRIRAVDSVETFGTRAACRISRCGWPLYRSAITKYIFEGWHLPYLISFGGKL